MLSWINKQGVKSSDGWLLQRVDRFHYHYIEGERWLEMPVESNEIFLGKTLTWQSSVGIEPISIEKRGEIKSRILEAIKFMGTKYLLNESVLNNLQVDDLMD